MSYSDLSDRFDVVTKHIKKGANTVASLSAYFKSYKKTTENYAISLQKILEGLAIEFQDDSNTLEIALNGLYQCFKKNIADYNSHCKNIQLELIEPLELFLEHYNESINTYIGDGEIICKQLKKSKEIMVKDRHKYYKYSADAEKIEKQRDDEKISNKISQSRVQVNKSSENYMKSIEIVNKQIEEFDETVPNVMNSLQQNEENRIFFVKSTLEKFVKQSSKHISLAKENLEQISGLVNNVNSAIDVEVYVDANKGRYKGGVKEEFISYQKWRDKRKEINDVDVKESDENCEEVLEKAMNFIMTGEETDSDSSLSELDIEEPEFSKISEALKNSNFRSFFLDLLESRKYKSFLTQAKMTCLVTYLKSLLTAILIDDDKDPFVFCKILSLLHCFYTETPELKRKYLSQLLSSHSIWTDKLRWVEGIEYTTSVKIFSDKESIKKIPKPGMKKTGIFGALKNIAHKIPNVFQKEIIGDESEKTAAFIVITQFSFYMSHLSLPLEVCNSIILLCCQRANLDSNRTCTLLAELEASQRANVFALTPMMNSLRFREKERKNFGKEMAIGLSIEYLFPCETVVLLYVCKKWTFQLKDFVYKKCLMDWDLPKEKIWALRNLTWMSLLKNNIREIDYQAFLQRVKANPEIEMEEVISLDVSRSYQNSSEVPSESLKNVLLVYSFYNPEVGYCQGMNYIAGTILSQFQNEEKSLIFMVALIEKFQMTELFTMDLPKLKQFFYQLDRLIGMELPELHELFKQINIGSGHFCAPWFITLFASHLQNRPNLLIKLWDLFLFEGWKTMFKAAIVILRRLSKELVSSKFEDIMFALSGIQGLTPIVDVFDENFIKSVQVVNITNSLLKSIEDEYQHLKSRAEKHTKR